MWTERTSKEYRGRVDTVDLFWKRPLFTDLKYFVWLMPLLLTEKCNGWSFLGIEHLQAIYLFCLNMNALLQRILCKSCIYTHAPFTAVRLKCGKGRSSSPTLDLHTKFYGVPERDLLVLEGRSKSHRTTYILFCGGPQKDHLYVGIRSRIRVFFCY